MQITKRDIITITVLSVIFFMIASTNVGYSQAPITTWQGTDARTFYLDLGSAQDVGNLYFFVNAGNATIGISIGSPGNWTSRISGNIHADSSWSNINVGTSTRYILVSIQPTYYDSRPNFYWSVPNTDDVEPGNFIKIAEVGVGNTGNNQKITIANLTDEGIVDPALSNLVDEQAFVQLPPTYMSHTYFDELYFVRAAQDYLNHTTSFERTHPPLGKLIQASGIALFGDTPFGWREMGVIFGTLMIPALYLLAKKLFGTWIGAFSASFLLTFDFLHFTMARMGTADTYVAFFSIITQLFFFVYFLNVVKHGWKTSVVPLFLAFVFFALGFSTKWLSLWAALGMIALLVVLRFRDLKEVKGWAAKYQAFFNHPFLLMVGFVGVVAGIYFLTYLPDLLTGTSFFNVVNLQFQMYGFHSSLTSTHSFMSSWWSWPFMVSPTGYVPLWLEISYLPNGIDSTISVMGNPAVWWVGFASVIVVIERGIRGQELASAAKRKLKLKALALKRKLLRKPKPIDVPDLPIAEPIEVSLLETSEQPQTILEPQIASDSPLEIVPEPAKTGRPWDLAAAFIASVFLFSWLSYIFISRATFIYHFFISVPLLCLASAYLINQYWSTKKGKVAAIIFFAVVLGMFIAFYPVFSGMPVSSSWIHNLKWFPSWYFAP
jgi:dolichyl-phosphate-mannose-protein mannosyltransferase